ncbi:MAG TPA: PIN domain-containing protein [Candidatus Kapabacteria bacterium]|nr:PIN domain-containing protein [Candidatus Kapabacteria bacterium]HPO63337.1 PIN domain-containing protein [Candidatus Kapabacteria bacterium]
MGKKYIVDTNIIIYYLDNQIPLSQLHKIENIFIESFNISTITKIELLGWHKINNTVKKKIEEFISNSQVFYFDSIIEKKVIEIKQEFKIAIPDAIIAATALINNFIVVTRNEKDFINIPQLNIYNPFC